MSASGQVRAMRAAADAALAFVEPGCSLGVGTGRTAAAFVAALAARPGLVRAAVPSSERTAALLRSAGIEAAAPVDGIRLDLYVDGADAVDPHLRLLKGGGGAHAREKRLAVAADRFVCIVDDTKLVASLAGRSVPVEIADPDRDAFLRAVARPGVVAALRAGFRTDAGNGVFDLDGLDLSDPLAVERTLEALPGVVACGIFAARIPDIVLIGHPDGTVERREPSPADRKGPRP